MKIKTLCSNPAAFPGRPVHLGVIVASLCLFSNLPAQTAQTNPRETTSDRMSNTSSSKMNDSSSSAGMLKRADRRFITKVADGGHDEMAMAQLATQRADSPDVRNYAQQLVTDHQKMAQDLSALAQKKGVMLEMSSASMASMDYPNSTAAGRSATGTGASTGVNTSAMNANRRDRADSSSTPGSMPTTNMGANANGDTTPVSSDTTGMSHGSGLTAKWSEMFGSEHHYKRLAKESGREFDAEFLDSMIDEHESDVKLFEKTSHDATDPDVTAFATQNLPTLRDHLDKARMLAKSTK